MMREEAHFKSEVAPESDVAPFAESSAGDGEEGAQKEKKVDRGERENRGLGRVRAEVSDAEDRSIGS